MLRYFFRLHFMAILAVIGSLVGSLLMFLIGGWEIIEAFLLFFRIQHPTVPGMEIVEAVATVLSALDNFLLGIILLYFAYNLTFLLTFPGDREKHFGTIQMPPGLHVETLGHEKNHPDYYRGLPIGLSTARKHAQRRILSVDGSLHSNQHCGHCCGH